MINDKAQLLIQCYCSMSAIDRSIGNGAYLIVQLVWGSGAICIGNKRHTLTAGDVIFISPADNIAWHLSTNSSFHFCRIPPGYWSDRPHVAKLFQQHDHSNRERRLHHPNGQQSSAISLLFKMIRQEADGTHADKKEAILIHLQMFLLLSNRVHRYQQNSISC